ncbi:hypothetical protein [Nonomuraea sp. 10N515B]|uniref:hypothetical protein n=1 Tax=Nonomuraea sp. 10N515B TaxID=3457422 RepID=UPI003FCC968B
MDFWRAIGVVLRRWYVALPALLLTLAGAYAVYTTVPPRYESTGVLSLTVPISGPSKLGDPRARIQETNPLLNFDSGLNMSASILVQILGSENVMTQLGASPYGQTTYEVNNGHPNPELLFSEPFVLIRGRSGDPESAKAIVSRVAQRAKVELTKRQKELKAPPTTYIVVTEILPPTNPIMLRTDRMRFTAAVLLLGMLAALASAFAAESIAAGLRRRRDEDGEPATRTAPASVDEPALQR